MNITYNRHAIRARKARLARRLDRKPVLLSLKMLIALLAAGGLAVLIVESQSGYLLLAAALIPLLLLLWFYGELKTLPGQLQNGQELALDQVLHRDVLAKLKTEPAAKDIWHAIKGHWQQQFFHARFGLDDGYFDDQLQQPVTVEAVWQTAHELSLKHRLGTITAGALTVALFYHTAGRDQALNILRLEAVDLDQGIGWLQHLENTFEAIRRKESYGGVGRDWAAGYTPLLNQLGHNISGEIQRSGLLVRDTAGHAEVISQMINILSKSQSSSVALVGDDGVGKTTAVYIMAKKLLTDKVYPNLRYDQVFTLNAATLIAAVNNQGSIEQLLLRILNEANRADNIILFLDEAQLFLRGGTGSIDLSNVLLPVLQSGRIHLILAMTPQEWQLLSSNNSSLAGLLNFQAINPPDKTSALQIMQDQLLTIEHKHKVVFTYQAIQEAYRLAEKYVQEQVFPGRGIKVLEETAVFAGSGLITPEVIGRSMEAKLGVKVVQASGAEKQQLLNLEDELHKRMINQVRAVSVVANALRRARSGVSNPNRPVGTFLFLGPTGVGKTELSKALADVYFGGREQIIRINMNEYSRPGDVSRLLAPTAESSSAFLPQIRRQPYSVVLLDEIEKAHPDVINVLLQLLDEGKINDSANKEASFRDAIIIATSNAGADVIRERITAGQNLEDFEEALTNQLIDSQRFTPEFLNRFDEIVLFRPLTPEELKQVVRLMIEEVNQTLATQKVRVTLTDAAVSWLVEKGNDPRLGARPMRRMVQRSVENIIAQKILSGATRPGSEIPLDVPDLETAGQ
jgi:ATP-dependent Clp protease ATP-binding subunit ClpC